MALMAGSSADIASNWAMGLVEPLLTLPFRLHADGALSRAAADDPDWFRVWAAGTLCDITGTLPPGDPWRQLSAAIPGGPSRPAVPLVGTAGAWLPDGTPFGAWQHAESGPGVPHVGPYDWHQTRPALAEGLTAVAAALLGFSFDGAAVV